MSQAVFIRRVSRVVVQSLLDFLDLNAFKYWSCSSLHLVAMHPLNTSPYPIAFCTDQVEFSSNGASVVGLPSCQLCSPVIIACHSCGSVCTACIQLSSSIRALDHFTTAKSTGQHIICSLSSIIHEHHGHFACVWSFHLCIFFPYGKNFATHFDTHCCFALVIEFMAFSTMSQSIVFLCPRYTSVWLPSGSVVSVHSSVFGAFPSGFL